MTSTSTNSVNFTIRRPTPASAPISRATSSGPDSDSGPSSFKIPTLARRFNDSTPLGSPLARSATTTPPVHEHSRDEVDSSDEDSAVEDELVTGFDKFGVQRLNGDKIKDEGPLVIPALKNKDWRAVARKRRGQPYLPPSAAQTGADGSVGGLGTTETIGTEPAMAGLYVRAKETVTTTTVTTETTEDGDKMDVVQQEETEDERALRAILAEATGQGSSSAPVIEIISRPVSEADALKQDVAELPDVATLDDYERVPVEQFGAALLRGMGWKEGTSASRKPGKGPVDPFIPATRPALLGLGAKEQEVFDDGSQKKKYGKPTLLVKPLIPLKMQERDKEPSKSRDRSRSPRRSAHQSSSRRGSRSPDRSYSARGERPGDSSRKRDRDRYRDDDRDRRDSRRDDRDRDRDRERERDRDKDRRRDDDRDYRDSKRRDDRDRERDGRDRKPDYRESSSRKRDY